MPGFVESARAWLGDEGLVVEGRAEQLPLASSSQRIVLLESVLEHVDATSRALAEIHRVLEPGGALFVTTTNRHALAFRNGEFNVPFYQWLPPALKESYVFFHLHHRPSLANYSERPAVHWFSFADLCRLGREAGFSRFYSHVDLTDVEAVPEHAGLTQRLRRTLLRGAQRSPWLRALVLTQRGGAIVMCKDDTDAATQA
jgi:SAM-dependent methyltransferase